MTQVIPPEDLEQLQAQFAQAQDTDAVKFMPQAGQITVALTQRGTHAQIQVTGTGKGIKPDFLPQQIRALEQTKQVPAIALTARGEFDRQLAIASEFQRHLAKPVALAEIVRMVARLCGRKGGNAE